MTTTTASYRDQLATARNAHDKARAALDLARKHVEPPSAELHKLFLTKPADYATCLRKMADKLDTLPALTAAVESTGQAVAALETDACWKCRGTGDYDAPTSHFQRGRPVCFKCGGTGRKTN